MTDVRDLMLDILGQYQKMDKIGFSLGLLDKTSSFSDAVSWCSIIGKLDHNKQTLDKMSQSHLVKIVDYLDELTTTFNEQVVIKIQQYRDLWMKKVLLWDLLLFASLILATVIGFYWTGEGFASNNYIELIKQRPIFLSLIVSLVVIALFVFHFFIRRNVISNILKNLEDTLSPGMSLRNTLNYNTRVRHSIFRPVPVGWNYVQKQRIESISRKIIEIRDKLGDVLASSASGEIA